MSDLQPSEAQLREAQDGLAMRGWKPSKSKSSPFMPVEIREDDGTVHACEHCAAGKQNPARWPLFFRTGAHAGQLLWTCTTCRRAQADNRGVAVILVEVPTRCDTGTCPRATRLGLLRVPFQDVLLAHVCVCECGRCPSSFEDGEGVVVRQLTEVDGRLLVGALGWGECQKQTHKSALMKSLRRWASLSTGCFFSRYMAIHSLLSCEPAKRESACIEEFDGFADVQMPPQ